MMTSPRLSKNNLNPQASRRCRYWRTLLCLSIFAAWSLHANSAELIISEYIEGSGNNKALEIYNPNDTSIDLSNYQLKFYFNGNPNAGLSISLLGSLAAKKVHVIAHAQASAEILAVANQTNASSWYNGDDAIALLNNGVLIDSIGQIGFDPGNSWSDAGVSTMDMTLRRQSLVRDTDTSDHFIPSAQWSAFAINSFDDLGRFGADDVPGETDLGQCGDSHLLPHDVQGSASVSPLNNQVVIMEAVVTADFRASNLLRGVFVQSPEYEYDDDARSSEAVFVYDPNGLMRAPIGQRVRLLATVNEYSAQTQLTQVQAWKACGSDNSVNALSLNLPLSENDSLESYEGMLVRTAQELAVNDSYNLARYGELVLSFGGRLWQPTELVSPGAAAMQLQAQNNARRILLDDASSAQNPAPIIYPAPSLSYDNSVRVGDTVRSFTAVLSEAFGHYRLQPTEPLLFERVNQRREAPKRTPQSTMRIASFNVLNYFNGDGKGGGFPTSRGANTAQEFARQREKIANALLALDADIIGLMEIENDGDEDDSALADLVNALNQRSTTGPVWQRVLTGQLGSDEIRVALIYRSDRVLTQGAAQRLDTGVFAHGNRVPLSQRFAQASSAQVVRVVVNHFKSKGSCPSDTANANADRGDGQSCWNALRTQAALELSQWLNDNSGANERTALIGDFNAYLMEDPIRAFIAQGYQTVSEAGAYSYVFDGQSGQLDHGLVNGKAKNEIVQVKHWNINADEPRALDYNLEFKTVEQQLSLYGNGPYRSSDHDPLVIDFGERQFGLSAKQRNMPMFIMSRESSLSFVIPQEVPVNAAEFKAQLFHRAPNQLQFILRAPDGSETPLNLNFGSGYLHTIDTKQLIPDVRAKGVWKLIVRSHSAWRGVLYNSELKLD